MKTRPPAATRINLVRARRDMARVQKGAALVRRKREAHVAELFRVARPAMDSRAQIDIAARAAAEALLGALGARGASALEQMSWPRHELEIDVEPVRVWGLAVSDVVWRPRVARTVEGRVMAPGTAGPAATLAATRYEVLADLLIEAAPREQRVRRLSESVARASRQLRTLEQQVAPKIAAQIAVVRRQLDEREREERLRLKHIQRRHAGGVR
jgi:V/A-type H+-transporting ATPase subunit D